MKHHTFATVFLTVLLLVETAWLALLLWWILGFVGIIIGYKLTLTFVLSALLLFCLLAEWLTNKYEDKGKVA